jgi:tripeptide aminopeptidase
MRINSQSVQQYSFKGNKNDPAITYINKDRMVDTFIRLVKVDTMSHPGATDFPSSEGQKVLAKMLADELRTIGLEDVHIDRHHVVTATLPDNLGNIPDKPIIGLSAHLDTSKDSPSDNVNPVIHKNYQGGDIKLKDGIFIPASDLIDHIGEDIITSDGTTLLGADDKAGIAEILEVLRVYKEQPHIKHPKLRIAFTPDEETGEYIKNFNIKAFGADAAYTLDGKDGNCLDTATFNAYNVTLKVKGRNVHTGEAKDKLVNANKIILDIMNGLPESESPEKTSGEQGFYHIEEMSGSPSEGKLKILIRDFDFDRAKERVAYLEQLARDAISKYPAGRAGVEIEPVLLYRNQKDFLTGLPEVVNNALEGIQRTFNSLGYNKNPKESSIRGGTDGSTMSEKGLPVANLEAGWHNAHARNEFVTVEKMVECAANIINTLSVWAEKAINKNQKE